MESEETETEVQFLFRESRERNKLKLKVRTVAAVALNLWCLGVALPRGCDTPCRAWNQAEAPKKGHECGKASQTCVLPLAPAAPAWS